MSRTIQKAAKKELQGDLPDRLYQVERICGFKYDSQGVYYKIKWKGYSFKETTWEPIAHLNNIPCMVSKYNQKVFKDMQHACIQPPKKNVKIEKQLTIKANQTASLNSDTKSVNQKIPQVIDERQQCLTYSNVSSSVEDFFAILNWPEGKIPKQEIVRINSMTQDFEFEIQLRNGGRVYLTREEVRTKCQSAYIDFLESKMVLT